ncbi:MAG: hypothetical protein IKC65_04335, partial [Lentisphaeria bacterium]|nr:hypothetical protein [Lentisphaeria bacterium]
VQQEGGQAPLRTFVPTVYVSSGKWQDRAGTIASFLQLNSAPEKNPRSAQLATRLVKELPREGTQKERLQRQVKALRDFSAKYIRQAGPGLESLPLNCISSADETLQAGYGSSADRAVQLAAMLRSLDINVEFLPVSHLLYEEETIRKLERFPQMIFGDVLLYLPALGIYLNDTGQYARLGSVNSSDRVMLSLKNRRLEALREGLRFESKLKKEIKIELQKDCSAVLRIKTIYAGKHFESGNRRFSEMTPELEKRHFASLASELSRAAEITGTPKKDFESYPGTVEYTVKVPGFARKTGDYLAFDLPYFAHFANAAGPVRKLRRTPFIRRTAVKLDIKYDITLPEGYFLSSRPSARMTLGDYAVGSFLKDLAFHSGRLLIDCRLKLPAGIVQAVDFDRLFTLKQRLARPDAGRIILIPKSGGKK